MSQTDKQKTELEYAAQCAESIAVIAENHNSGWWEPRLDPKTGLPRFLQFSMASHDPLNSKKFIFDLERFSFMAYGLHCTRAVTNPAALFQRGIKERKTDIVLEMIRRHKANFQFSHSYKTALFSEKVIPPADDHPQGYTTINTFLPTAVPLGQKSPVFEVSTLDFNTVQIDVYSVKSIGLVECGTYFFLIFQRFSSDSNIAFVYTNKELAQQASRLVLEQAEKEIGKRTGEVIVYKF